MLYTKKINIKKLNDLFTLIVILISFNLVAFLLINNTPNKYQAKILFEPSKLNNEYLISIEEILAKLKTSESFSKTFKLTQVNSLILAEVQSESADKANLAIQYLLDNIENDAITVYNSRVINIEKKNQLTKDLIDITNKVVLKLDNSTRKKWLSLVSERFEYFPTKRIETKIILKQEGAIKPLYKKPILIYLVFNIIGLGVFFYHKTITSSTLAYLRKKYS